MRGGYGRRNRRDGPDPAMFLIGMALLIGWPITIAVLIFSTIVRFIVESKQDEE